MPKPGRRQPKPSGDISGFTDREDQQLLFRRHLASPLEPPVLVFYGVGGAGKTWLLKKLWKDVSASIPRAFLDFETRGGGQRFLADPATGLYEIRQQLAQPASRFDIAYAMMHYKRGTAAEPSSRGEGFLGLTMELVAEIAQKATDALPGVNVVLNRLGRHLRSRLRNSAIERFLFTAAGSDFVLALRPRTSQEIGNDLLDYLAEDLRESLTPRLDCAVRAVLFFDTFEAVRLGLQNSEHQRFREEWIREIAANFDFALTVIAGQNRLTWEDAEPEWSGFLDQHVIGGLSEMDARFFLGECQIEAADLQNAILATAREADGGHHCFSLGLCADIVYAERQDGHEPVAETLTLRPGDWEALSRRFLKSLSSDAERRWVEILALTPRFDEAAARCAFSSQHSAAQDEAWETLPRFSFVERLPSGWFTVRAQMRWALENRPTSGSSVFADHEWWQLYWQARSTSYVDDEASLAWYHRYSLEPTAALAGC